MQFFISVALLTLAVFVSDASRIMLSRSTPIFSDAFIDQINQLNSTWKAGRNFDENYSLEHLRRLLGTRQDDLKLPLLQDKNTPSLSQSELPDDFDARERWPECSTIRQIRDQGCCNSCWAFGAVGAMSDRVCIHSGGKLNVELSAQDLLSCCEECAAEKGDGCKGGYPREAWEYYRDNGIVTGGLYGSEKSCQPYKLRPSGRKTTTSKREPCLEEEVAPACSNRCQARYRVPFLQDKHYARKIYRVDENEIEIMNEIMKNGPVQASFAVFADFGQYKSGVYRQFSDKYAGHHSVRILGWGVENNDKYWLCANSWNRGWSELGGFFKILRGVNECGIEESIMAGIPE